MQSVDEIQGPEVAQLATMAREFLAQQRWCRRVTGGEVGLAEPGVIGIFKLRFEPSERGVPDELWVVVGDLPSAYIDADDAPSWREALEGYIHEMRRWVDAVRTQQPLDDVIPIDAAPTEAHAAMLASRLALLQRHLLNEAATE